MFKKLSVFIFIFLALGIFTKTVLAQDDSVATPSQNVQKVEYDLPYPGLLPDNPLYFLKSARDKLIEILIASPQKKAEFFLLSSDKRVNTGYYLIQKNKKDLGVLYISKSNNYMHMAITSAKSAGETGTSLLSKMLTSIQKHEEIIKTVEGQVDKKNRTQLENELKRLEEFTTLINKK